MNSLEQIESEKMKKLKATKRVLEEDKLANFEKIMNETKLAQN